MKNILLIFCLLFSIASFSQDDETVKKRKRFKDYLIFPIVGYNDNDNFMLGLKFQIRDTSKNFNFHSYNLYSFKGHITGLGEFKYRIKLNSSSSVKSIVPFVQYQRFSLFENNTLDYNLLYNRISPGVRLKLRCSDEHRCKTLLFKSSFINEGYANFTSPVEFKITSLKSNMNRLGYYYSHSNQNSKYRIQFWTELDHYRYETPLNTKSDFLKITAAYSYKWALSNRSNFGLRFWGSYFIMNDERESTNYSDAITRGSAALIYQGHNDYAYDEVFLGRNNIDGVFRNQFSNHGGGFKTTHTLTSDLGQSNNLALAMNAFIEAPFSILKLKPIIFGDIGSYSLYQFQTDEFQNKYLYSFGIGIKSRNNNIGIYLPLFNSADINNNYSNNDYNLLNRISVNLSLNPYY